MKKQPREAQPGDILGAVGTRTGLRRRQLGASHLGRTPALRRYPWRAASCPTARMVMIPAAMLPRPKRNAGDQFSVNTGPDRIHADVRTALSPDRAAVRSCSNTPCLHATPDMRAATGQQLDWGARRCGIGYKRVHGRGDIPRFRGRHLTVRLGAIAANYRSYLRLAGPGRGGARGQGRCLWPGRGLRGAGAWRGPAATHFSWRGWKKALPCAADCATARIFVLDGAPPDARTGPDRPSPDARAEFAGRDRGLECRGGHGAPRTLDAAVHIDTGMNRLGLPGEELSILPAEWQARLEGYPSGAGDEPSGLRRRTRQTR